LSDVTTIRITKATRERLAAEGKKRETYDQIINRVLDFCEKYSRRRK